MDGRLILPRVVQVDSWFRPSTKAKSSEHDTLHRLAKGNGDTLIEWPAAIPVPIKNPAIPNTAMDWVWLGSPGAVRACSDWLHEHPNVKEDLDAFLEVYGGEMWITDFVIFIKETGIVFVEPKVCMNYVLFFLLF